MSYFGNLYNLPGMTSYTCGAETGCTPDAAVPPFHPLLVIPPPVSPDAPGRGGPPIIDGAGNILGGAASAVGDGVGNLAGGVKDKAGQAVGLVKDSICNLPGGQQVCAVVGVVRGLDAVASTIIDLFSQHSFWIRVVLVLGGVFGVMIGLGGLANIETQQVADKVGPALAAAK